MKIWSIGLAIALTFAALDSASAGFAIVAGGHSAIPTVRASMANHIREAARFGPRDSRAFRQGRDRQPQFISLESQDAPIPSPAADSEPFGFGGSAPIINVTFAAPAPGQAYLPPQTYAAAGPKIIMIGTRPRSTHFSKMPLVVYGTTQAGRSY
ncbi:hypothetical protein [Methylocapsa sp. S129]|uniref:hypothetical protein n=1 Tax=Methylocapsa sp. S129 TaxID=1641869 RepID=UPI00131CD3C6|nr:hypothetical protein [Methylocapsa sp. S129]